jgi:hypothetical protein
MHAAETRANTNRKRRYDLSSAPGEAKRPRRAVHTPAEQSQTGRPINTTTTQNLSSPPFTVGATPGHSPNHPSAEISAGTELSKPDRHTGTTNLFDKAAIKDSFSGRSAKFKPLDLDGDVLI